MTKLDWEINIENLAASVAEAYGKETVKGIFARFDATCFDDLNPSYYADIFGELILMYTDS